MHLYGAIAAGRRAQRYPTDMTDAEWAQIRASMPVPAWLKGRGGRPEAFCHREMVDAVRYVVDNGAKWRAVPADYPWWRAVYDFFRRWSRHGYVRELYQRLRRLERVRQGRAAEPTPGIMDAQSVDGSETCPAATRGVDGNKRRDGRKRHILTDTGGLLLEVTVTPANVHDSVAAPELLDAFMVEPGRLLKLVWADTAYQGPALADAFAAHGVRAEVVRRPDGTGVRGAGAQVGGGANAGVAVAGPAAEPRPRAPTRPLHADGVVGRPDHPATEAGERASALAGVPTRAPGPAAGLNRPRSRSSQPRASGA